MKGRFQPTTVGNMAKCDDGGYVCVWDYQQLEAKNAALREQLAAAQKDAERLDFATTTPVGKVHHENGRVFATLDWTRATDPECLPDGTKLYAVPPSRASRRRSPTMRVFEHFNASHGSVCPVCRTAADRPTVLVAIPGTEDDGICEAKQVHKQCFDLATEMAEAEKEAGKC